MLEVSLTRITSVCLTWPITPRSRKRRVIEPRVMPWAVFTPAMTTPGTSREGLRSSEMCLRYLEYLNLWACSLKRPARPRLRATAPASGCRGCRGRRCRVLSSQENQVSAGVRELLFEQRCVRSPEMAGVWLDPSNIPFRASRRSATAGRQGCKSEMCTTVAITAILPERTPATNPALPPERVGSPSTRCSAGNPLGSVELLGGFEVR